MSDKQTMKNKNRRIGIAMLLMAFGMVGMSFAAVPLYQIFCQVTGYGGTTQQAEENANGIIDRDVTVRFDASVNSAVPWHFKPVQKSVSMKVGEQALAFFKAENYGDAPVTGTATFNVTPQKAGQYFVKVDCFCFTEQTLNPSQEVDMPVTFYVDPGIDDDPNMADVETITLSYTFFRKEKEETGDTGSS